MSNYYDKKYFAWQKKAGLYGATQDVRFYLPFMKKSETVLDFGCGGGYILDKLPGRKKYGVDINTKALLEAEKKGIKTYERLNLLPKNVKFDTIISHHTLEHVPNPSEVLVEMTKHLTKQGSLIVIVPIDDWRKQKNYRMADINNHLYTWTPLLIHNLFKQAGYKVMSVDILTSAWLPLSRYYYPYVPKPIYYALSNLWSRLILSRQIRVVAKVA